MGSNLDPAGQAGWARIKSISSVPFEDRELLLELNVAVINEVVGWSIKITVAPISKPAHN